MKRRRRASALNDFLDALASKKAGELIGDSFSGIDLNGESLIGVDFCHCVFDNSIFYECDLSKANLRVNLAEAKKGATVAVKVTDMLGEEVLVVKQV